MSLFPELTEAAETAALPEPCEYAFDFETNSLKTMGGRYYTVTGLEALRIYIWKLLRTKKGRYPAYTAQYGHELESLFGESDKARFEAELKRLLKKALLNDYITDVTDLSCDYSGSACRAEFTVNTVYGDVEAQVSDYFAGD